MAKHHHAKGLLVMGTCDYIADQIGPKVWRQTCRYCGHVEKVSAENYQSNRPCPSPDAPDRHTQLAILGHGPGVYLIQVTHELGFKDEKGCGCNSLAAKMNRWGMALCRGEHREEILEHLRKRAAEAGWIETGLAGARMLAHLKWYNPLDPCPSMLEEACRRSESAIAELPSPPTSQ